MNGTCAVGPRSFARATSSRSFAMRWIRRIGGTIPRGRTDRECGDERPGGVDRDPGGAEHHGRARLGRRFRHGLFEHELLASAPHRQDEDRRGLHQGSHVAARRRFHRTRDRLAGPQPKIQVVAEGVESIEQLEFLKTLGCDQYQGIHFSPALPAAQFEALVRATSEDEPVHRGESAAHAQQAGGVPAALGGERRPLHADPPKGFQLTAPVCPRSPAPPLRRL